MIKRVLISLEIPDLAPWNRFSAVACVVCSFSEVLHNNGYEVFVNQFPFETVLKELKKEKEFGSSGKQPPRLVRLIPKRVREIVKDILLYKKLNKLYYDVAAIPRPDIIISWISYGSSNGSKLSGYWKVPLIAIYDNPLIEEYHFQLGFKPFFSKYIIRREAEMVTSAFRVIVYSPSMADLLKDKYKQPISFSYKQFIDRYKINFIESERSFHKINFLYVGSFFEWHRVDILISAFAELYKDNPKCCLYLVGGGPQQERIEGLVRENGLNEVVFFTGFQDGEALRAIMEKCHIGIIPSALWFHAPVKLFQYAAAGLCILATKTPTIEFIIQQDNSAIQLFDSKDELIVNMKKLAAHPETIVLNGTTSRRWIERQYNDKKYLEYFGNLFDTPENQ